MSGYTVDDHPETVARNRDEFGMAPPEILAEESPWHEKGRYDVMGRLWFPWDNGEWYRYEEGRDTKTFRSKKDAPWAQGWKG